MSKLRTFYQNRYLISRLDLADSGETNRLHILFISPFLFAFGIIDLIVLLTLQITRGGVNTASFVYFGAFTVMSAGMFVYAQWSKKLSREKAYIGKTIPFYVLLATGLVAAVYNFYILNQPFNGVLVYCLCGFLSLIAFSFSPLCFLFTMTIGLGFLIPGVYAHFGLTGLLDTILVTVVTSCCAFYRRRVEKKYIMLLKKQMQSLEAKTFGNFTLLYEGSVVKFSRTKSTELLAYLIYKNGSSVKTKELISVLWGDHADSARYGASLRNLIVDIKKSFADREIQNFFIAEYNNFRINPEIIRCDYYDFLSGDKEAIKNFAGEFMNQYSWAEDVASFLERKVLS